METAGVYIKVSNNTSLSERRFELHFSKSHMEIIPDPDVDSAVVEQDADYIPRDGLLTNYFGLMNIAEIYKMRLDKQGRLTSCELTAKGETITAFKEIIDAVKHESFIILGLGVIIGANSRLIMRYSVDDVIHTITKSISLDKAVLIEQYILYVDDRHKNDGDIFDMVLRSSGSEFLT